MESQQQQQWAQPQPTPPKSNSYQIFGIISLILGILAFIFSFVPCLGVYALVPGIIGLVLGIVGLVMANKVNGGKGMVITGIVLSLLGSAVAGWQYSRLHSAVSYIDSTLKDSVKMRELRDHFDTSFHDLDTTGMKITVDTSDIK